jgi:DNA-binding NtrC family response regulator
VVRVGSSKPVPVDVRVITATHKNLVEEVKSGNFRKDLYYRLIGLPIQLPPLRERGSDILLLAGFFADSFCKDNKKPRISFSEGARRKLMAYSFMGNVRELKSTVELAIILSDGKTVNEENISFNSLEPSADFLQEEMTLEQYEKKIVEHFMHKFDQNAILVAKKLGIGKSTIYRMLKKYDMKF